MYCILNLQFLIQKMTKCIKFLVTYSVLNSLTNTDFHLQVFYESLLTKEQKKNLDFLFSGKNYLTSY